MTGKTVLITGVNCGLGKEDAKDFAKRGARIIMACRNLEKANQARGECIYLDIPVVVLDLASFR